MIEATLWLKNGDHPLDYAHEVTGFENGDLRTWPGTEAKEKGWEGQVVRYFRDPDISGAQTCGHCGATMHDHGWIDGARNSGKSYVVCPGSLIVTQKDGTFSPVFNQKGDSNESN
jgi:hypothetical protein